MKPIIVNGIDISTQHKEVEAQVRKTKSRNPDDLIQAGYMGLMHAAKKFDPSRGFTFSTYSRSWVFKYVREEHRKNNLTVHFPKHVKEVQHHLSLEAWVSPENTLADILPCQDRIADELPEIPVLARRAFRAMDTVLNVKERNVIELRFLQDDSRKETADIMGLSQERVRQLEVTALAKLRNEICHD
jgi:RNA polymerase sigma factor (sigma-70 family)